MRCIEVRRLVDAYVDNETSAEQNTLLAKHAEGCCDCQALLDKAFQLDARVSLLDADQPETLSQRIRYALETPSSSERTRKEIPAMKKATLRFGLVTALTAAIATGVFLTVPRRAEAAWVNVKKAVDSVDSVQINWVYLSGDGTQQDAGTIQVIPGAKRLQNRYFEIVENESGCHVVEREGVSDGSCVTTNPDPANETFSKITNDYGQEPAYSGREIMNGRSLDVFTFKSELLNGGNVETSIPRTDFVYWVDPETNLPAFSEWRTYLPDGTVLTTEQEYHFNVPLAPELFDTPPSAKAKAK